MRATTDRRVTFVVPPGAEVRICLACGAAMAMRRTERGKLQPIDCPGTAYETTVVNGEVRARTLAREIEGEAHFYTCSDPDRFRRPR